jgi:phosphoglycolate phosphatase-like HAD superfamily hydrolase
MRTIKLIAINIDGVLLEDSFSPIIRNFVLKYGVSYSRELERNVFSQPQMEAAEHLAHILGSDKKTILKRYFEDRDQYLMAHGCNINLGVPELLEFLKTLDVRLVYYGGLSEDKISTVEFTKYKHYFERYICTNDFRPGIKEITKDFYGLEFHQVLFIDDVNTVAEVAKVNNVPFIGIPSDFPWGYQRQDMITTQVKYLLNSIQEITPELIAKIDDETAVGTVWK